MSPSFTLPALAMIKDNADIDNVDFEIVDLMQRNGRASYRSIAEALGVEEGQVKRRVNNLLKRNVIDIVAVLAFSPGSVVITVLTLNINGNFEQIGRQVAAWPEIQWLNICAGDADI